MTCSAIAHTPGHRSSERGVMGRATRWVGVGAVAVIALAAGNAGADVALATGGAWSRTGSGAGTAQTLTLNGTKAPPTSGTQRALIVVVAYEVNSGTTTSSVSTATYNGVNINPIVISGAANDRRRVWMGYLLDASLPANGGAAAALNVTVTADAAHQVTGGFVWAGFYTGVNQSTPVGTASSTSTGTSTTGVTSATFGATINAAAGGAIIYALSYGTANITTTPPASYTERWDTQNVNGMDSSGADRLSATAVSQNATVSFTSSTYGLAVFPLNPAPTNSITLADGTNPSGSTQVCPGTTAAYADQFAFTVAGANDTVGSVTFQGLNASAPLSQIEIRDNAGAALSPARTGTPAAADTLLMSGTNLPANIGTTSYRLYFNVKSHAALAAGSYTVQPRIQSYTSTNTQNAGTDAANAFTIDNAAPGNATWGSNSAGNGQIVLNWTGAGGDTTEYVVVRKQTTPNADAPTEGQTYTVAGGPAIGTSTIVYVGSATTFTDTAVTNGQTYYYKIFARDACANYAAGVETGALTPLVQTLTVADGSNPAGSAICPVASAPVDGFTMQTSAGTAIVSGVTVTLTPVGAYVNVASVRVDCGAANATTSPVASDLVSVPIVVSIGAASPTSCTVTVTPKSHGALSAVGNLPVAGTVTNVAVSGYTPSVADASSSFTIDNAPPTSITLLGATGGDARVDLAWANPGSDFGKAILVRKQGTVVTFSPADGTDYLVNATPVAGETVIYADVGAAFSDAPLTNGTAYHYKVVARDACNNWSGAAIAVATPSAFVGEGDTTGGSTRPVVAIVNPAKGAVVKTPFKVQARIFSPGGRVLSPAPRLYVDGTPVDMTASLQYGTTASSGIWEYQVASLAAGGHDLRVWAENATGGVYTAIVHVTIAAGGTGDGNLLVRDNSSQLCSDCHSLPSHSAEATGTKWGSWSTTCRDCHDPHGTKNIALVAEKITPPALAAAQTPKDVVFYNRNGFGPNAYANASGTGPCQVCHTRTAYFKADGTGTDHNPTSNCGSCHKHVRGLAATCTECHGTAGRTRDASVAGAVDSALEASPPRDTDTNPANDALRVGAHLAHVNQGTYRTNALACADCHPWPNSHQTPSQRDAAWSALASTTGERAYTLSPPAGVGSYDLWETGTPSCTNWCHGAGLGAGGGANTGPNWTLGSSQAACGTCHASPPPVDATAAGDHPQNVGCASCHGTGYAQASVGGTAKDTHVDGTIQKPANGCTACHGKLAGLGGVAAGSTNPEAAPGYDALSVDTHGSSDRAQVGVGAHVRHVNAGMMSAKTCNVCHPLPADGDTSHASGGATQMAWASPANAGGVSPSYAQPSCTSYCHSSGDPMGAATPTTVAISWTSQTALGCSSCHASTSIATNAHGKHVPRYTCNECHVGTTPDGSTIGVGGGLHVNGANDVGFDSSSLFVQGGAYATAQCSNIYCHSSGSKRSPPYTSGPSLAWNATATCTSCHGGPQTSTAPIATGRHPNHVNVAGTIGGAASTNSTCGTCHASTVAVNTDAPVTGAGAHVDRVASVTFDALYGGTFTQGVTEGTGSCASSYCHSSGQDPAAIPAIIQYRSVSWDGAALGCNGCHGTGNATGAPDYANGGANVANSNSHPAHVGTSVLTCAICHAQTTTTGAAIAASSTLHIDRAREVTWDATRVAAGAVYNQASKSCSSTGSACHGSKSPTWGGTLTCAGCHGTEPRPQDVGVAGTVDPNLIGAPPTGLAGETLVTTRAVGAHIAHVNQGNFRQNALTCSECHSGATHDGTRQVAAGGSVATSNAFGTSPTITWSGTTCANTYCHGNITNGNNQTITWAQDTTLGCQSCHLSPPLNPSSTPVAGTHPNDSNCNACHSGYSLTAPGASTGTVVKATHIDGKLDGGVSNGNDRCVNCHKYEMELSEANLTASYHHVVEQDNVVASGLTVYPTTAQPTVATATIDKTCVQCHSDHNTFQATNTAAETRAMNLRVSIGTPPPAAADGANLTATPGTHIANTDSTNAATTAGACISCHASTQTKNTTNQASDGTTQTYALDATAYGGSAHNYYVAGNFPTPVAGAFSANCGKCHNSSTATKYQDGTYTFALHTSADRRLRAPLGQATFVDDHGEDFCFRCHSTTANAAAIGGTTKPAANNDWYGAVTTMTAASQDLFTRFDGVGGAPVYGTTTTNTLNFRNNATANVVRPTNLPAAYIWTTAGATYQVTTFTRYDMATTTGTSANLGRSITTTVPRYYRFAQFLSPPVDTVTTLPAGQVITVTTTRSANNASLRAYERIMIYARNAAGTANTAINSGGAVQNATFVPTASTTQTWAQTFPISQDVVLQPGDYLVAELEWIASTAPSATVTGNEALNTANSRITLPVAATFRTGAVASKAGHGVGSYTGVHRPNPAEETSAYISANRHVECEDCHNPHAAAATPAHVHPDATTAKTATNNQVSGALKGATGVTPTFATTTVWPATTAITYSNAAPLNAATDKEYQICMKCHSGANSQLAAWNASWTDVARDFNPGNRSYHPVVQALPATNANTYGSVRLGGTKNWVNGWGVGMTMWCTDCHGGETTNASFGPHGSGVTYMLRGGTWPKNSGGSYFANTNGAVIAGNMCFMCHGALTTVAHTRSGDHSVECLRCHIRIPHGGKVPRLLAAKGNLTGCGNVPQPYCDPAMPPYLAGFILSTTGSYAESNCAQNGCSQHGGTVTNGETW